LGKAGPQTWHESLRLLFVVLQAFGQLFHLSMYAFCVLFLDNVLEQLSFATFIPLLPQLLAESDGVVKPSLFGLAQSIANGVSLFTLIGLTHLSDTYGRQETILLSQIVSVAGSFCFLVGGRSFATLALTLKQVHRSASRSVSKAYVIDIVTSEERAASISRMMAGMSLGFAIGSSCGGFLEKVVGLKQTLYFSALAGLASIVTTFFFLPSTKTRQSVARGKEKENSHESVSFVGAISSLQSAATNPLVVALMLVRLLTTLAFQCFISTFSLMAKQRFDWSSEELGYSLTFIGLCFSVTNLVIVPPLTRAASPVTLMVVALSTLTASRILFAVAESYVVFGSAQVMPALLPHFYHLLIFVPFLAAQLVG
jgi:DHA1 family tetracycline resistance protein-like MFS transporter